MRWLCLLLMLFAWSAVFGQERVRNDSWVDSDSLWVSYRELTAAESSRIEVITRDLVRKRLWFQCSPQPANVWWVIVKKEDVAVLDKILKR